MVVTRWSHWVSTYQVPSYIRQKLRTLAAGALLTVGGFVVLGAAAALISKISKKETWVVRFKQENYVVSQNTLQPTEFKLSKIETSTPTPYWICIFELRKKAADEPVDMVFVITRTNENIELWEITDFIDMLKDNVSFAGLAVNSENGGYAQELAENICAECQKAQNPCLTSDHRSVKFCAVPLTEDSKPAFKPEEGKPLDLASYTKRVTDLREVLPEYV